MGVQNCGVNYPISLKAVLQEISELANRDVLQSKANYGLVSALEDTIPLNLQSKANYAANSKQTRGVGFSVPEI